MDISRLTLFMFGRRRELSKRTEQGIVLLMLVLGLSMLAISIQPAETCVLAGDVNEDGRVDMEDIAIVAGALGSYGPGFVEPGSLPHPRWNAAADVSGGDNKVDFHDLVFVAMNYGKESP